MQDYLPEIFSTPAAVITIRALGWIGAALVLLAFLLVGRKILDPDSKQSAILNLAGAALLTINTLYFTAFASCALNVIWAVIALWNLISFWNQADPKQSPNANQAP